ncbi:major capsid protein [Pseudomonas sp. Pseusp97]|uniref:major capsid protein n=1 Tax=Pseudomonas sp. Pseusp97 TaxID=3243065 RepID=UPI0039A7608C
MIKYQSKKEMLKAGLKSLPVRAGMVIGGLTMAATSFAADDVDTAPILAKLAACVVAVAAVASAALGVVIVVKTYKYVRTAL